MINTFMDDEPIITLYHHKLFVNLSVPNGLKKEAAKDSLPLPRFSTLRNPNNVRMNIFRISN